MKKREIDLLSGEPCISLINEPIDFEVAPLTAIERARRKWNEADLICGGRKELK